MRHPERWILAGLLLAGLGLRLWSIDHGLPFAYNADEELHFVPIAVEMFNGSLNPHYFENPPALTYLFYLVFKLRYTVGFPFGGGGFVRDFLNDPESVFLTARTVVALLGTLLIGLVYWAGTRFFERRVGLVAAALIAFSFVPVWYSKQALNDVVTLLPLTVAVVGALFVFERGRALDWVLAGAAVGAAVATKYTAGAVLVALALATLFRLLDRRDSVLDAVRGLVIAGVAFAVVFLALNPYSLLDFSEFRSQVGGQAGTAGALAKLGQDDVPGWIYYLWTLTWGFGWLPLLAAVAGAVLALRSGHPRRALILIAFPLVLFVFLGFQSRYFARWYLPAYPMLAILAGYAAVRAADALSLRSAGRLAAPALVVAIAALLVGQGLIQSVRQSVVLAHEDTRTLSRGWLFRNVPAGERVVVEPFIPAAWLRPNGRFNGEDRYDRYVVKRPFQGYERRLRPEQVQEYASDGYCWVVTGSHQKQRGLKASLANAREYYRRLDAATERRWTFSPFELDEEPVEFNFDLSFNYLPEPYLRPGPLVEVHRLRGCGQGITPADQ